VGVVVDVVGAGADTVAGAVMRELKGMLLGPFSVMDGRRVAPAQLLRKAQDLLTLVLISPERRVLREAAAEALWPGAPAETSRKAMRQALWQIHHATDDGVADSRRLLLSDNDALVVNPDRPLWVDVPVFTDAARVAQSAGAGSLDPANLPGLASAATLYRGPLHAGCLDEWCLVPRARLEDRCLTLLDTLSREHERRGDLPSAISWAQRLLEIEPAHERSHRRLMRLYCRTGDRTRALRQLTQCRGILERELGVRPDSRTEQLGSAILAGTLPDGVAVDDAVARAGDATLVEALRLELLELRRSIDALGERLGDVPT
jgi:DNA-binding SARP family transcriptional activator